MPDFHDALSSGYPFVDSVHRRRPSTSHFSMRPKMPLTYVLSAGASCKCVIKECRWESCLSVLERAADGGGTERFDRLKYLEGTELNDQFIGQSFLLRVTLKHRPEAGKL